MFVRDFLFVAEEQDGLMVPLRLLRELWTCLLKESLLLSLNRFNLLILSLLFIIESPQVLHVATVAEVVLLR